jgi:2-iminoacetate synthase
MFSHQVNKLKKEIKQDFIVNESIKKYFYKCLNSNHQFSFEEANLLLSILCSDNVFYENTKKIIIGKRQKKFNNSVHLIIPEYLTNICSEDCKYCNFRRSNNTSIRFRLSNEEFIQEFNMILDWGYRIIELVYSTDSYFSTKRMSEQIAFAKKIASKKNIKIKIGLNSQPLSTNQYIELKNVGLDFLIIWMETYSHSYKNWHETSLLKSKFSYRLNSYERAINAGITDIGLGIMLGLGPWFNDVLMVVAHGLYLKKVSNIYPKIIGIPRLKETFYNNVNIKNDFSVNDNIFERVCFFYKAIFQDVMLFVNTRETLKTNFKIIEGGGDLFTIDCKTFPGAYLMPENFENKSEQFATFQYAKNNALDKLKNHNYDTLYDW